MFKQALMMAVFLLTSHAQAQDTKVLDERFHDQFTNERSYTSETTEGWVNGWVAQSYMSPLGTDMIEPTGYPVDRWLDKGNGLVSTDYLFAFEGERTYLYNAGTLRSGAIKIDKPGNYRLDLYVDRYWSSGTPRCDVKLSLDGTTIIDARNNFQTIAPQIVKDDMIEYAKSYKEFAHTLSPVFEVVKPGFYNLDFWSHCRDLNDRQQVYNLAFEYGNIQAKTLLNISLLSKVNLFYGGDAVIKDAMELREDISFLKAAIADNHGTFFDLVLENVDSGRKARITSENIWHKEEATPQKNFLRPSMSPKTTVAQGNWWFRGVRGTKDFVWEQRAFESPDFATAFANMPFVPEYLEARRKLTFEQSGTQGFALSYDPKGYRAEASWNMTNSAVLDIGGQLQRAIEAENGLKPTSEYTKILLEKHMPDGTIKRLTLFDGELLGNRYVGELKFIYANLPAGDYELVVLRDPRIYPQDRYGNIKPDVFFMSDSNFSLRIKQPSDETYQLVR